MQLTINLGAGKRTVSARLGRQVVNADLATLDREGRSQVRRRVVGMFAASQKMRKRHATKEAQ